MSVDPRETQAFASMLGKLNDVQAGKTADTTADKSQAMATNDMHSILSAFAETSGTESALALRPEQLTESKTEQKPGDSIGAEFEPKPISPVLGKPEKDHPMKGKLVGEDEAVTTEDSLTDIKKRLGDYLQDIRTGADVSDRDLKDKKQLITDKLGPAIKTITTDDGKTIKIHGNEDDGFRLNINNRPHSARFKSFDEAQMACETYVARKRATEDKNYVEEK